MVWLGSRRGHATDWITQRWVQATGRRVDLTQAPWLSGPCGSVRGIGADFFERWGASEGLVALPPRADDGLLEGLQPLAAPGFDPSVVHPIIHAFYAHTSAFDLDIKSRWAGPFRALGWLIARVFARRLAQLNLPLSDRELRGGVDSRIVRLADADGQVRHVGWVRTSVETGRPVLVGEYGVASLPGSDGPCVKVVFPLPNGNAVVVLRPRAEVGGGLTLLSDGTGFGDPGFYFTVVAGPGEVWARYVKTMKEQLHLWVEGNSLVARHRFAVFGRPYLELDYRMVHRGEAAKS